MSADMNPMGREYSKDEWKAAKRVGLALKQPNTFEGFRDGGPRYLPGGPLIYATGAYYPDEARKKVAELRRLADDWETLADAMDREWKKELPDA